MRGTLRGTTVQALSLIVLVGVAFAGCVGDAPSGPTDAAPAGDGDDDGAGTGGGAGGGAPPTVDADVAEARAPPTWQVGDWWTYRATGPDGTDTETTMVVADETSDAWIVRATYKEQVFFDARFDISHMGPQYKNDLAGSQGNARVEFFQWPLVEGEGWFTPWDDMERHIAVQSVAPDRSRVELVAHDPDGNVDVSFAYEPRVRWFTEMTFFDDDGEETWSIELQDSGRDYEGTYLTVEFEEVVAEEFGSFGGGYFPATVDAEDDDFWWEAAWEAESPGSVGFGYHYDGGDDPTASGGDQLFQATCPCTFTEAQGTLPADPAGGWSFEGGITAPAGGYLEVSVFLRDFTEHSLGGEEAY